MEASSFLAHDANNIMSAEQMRYLRMPVGRCDAPSRFPTGTDCPIWSGSRQRFLGAGVGGDGVQESRYGCRRGSDSTAYAYRAERAHRMSERRMFIATDAERVCGPLRTAPSRRSVRSTSRLTPSLTSPLNDVGRRHRTSAVSPLSRPEVPLVASPRFSLATGRQPWVSAYRVRVTRQTIRERRFFGVSRSVPARDYE